VSTYEALNAYNTLYQLKNTRLAEVSNSAATVISSAGWALVEWAGQLQQAQRSDASGRDSLNQANQILLDPSDNLPVGLVQDGVNSMYNGANTAASGISSPLYQLRASTNLYAIKPSAIVLS